MLLRSGRKRPQQMAECEAVDAETWTEGFTDAVRVKIKLVAADAIGNNGSPAYPYANGLLCWQRGFYCSNSNALDPTHDVIAALCTGDDDMVTDVVEVLYAAIEACGMVLFRFNSVSDHTPGFFASEVNRILREERVAYEPIEGKEDGRFRFGRTARGRRYARVSACSRAGRVSTKSKSHTKMPSRRSPMATRMMLLPMLDGFAEGTHGDGL